MTLSGIDLITSKSLHKILPYVLFDYIAHRLMKLHKAGRLNVTHKNLDPFEFYTGEDLISKFCPHWRYQIYPLLLEAITKSINLRHLELRVSPVEPLFHSPDTNVGNLNWSSVSLSSGNHLHFQCFFWSSLESDIVYSMLKSALGCYQWDARWSLWGSVLVDALTEFTRGTYNFWINRETFAASSRLVSPLTNMSSYCL